MSLSSPRGLQVDVVTSARAPDALERRWHELAVAAENPFVLPEWHRAWVATHPADAPCVLVCRESTGVIAGVVPLVLRGRRLLAAGEQLADWFGPACAPEDEARVAAAAVAAVSRMTRRWDVWQLDRCRSGGTWIDGLVGAAAGSAVKLLAHPGDDVLVSVDLAREGPDLRIAKKRRELARSARRLREAHDVAVRSSTTPTHIERDLDALLRLRAARWDASFDTAAQAFVREFSALLARRHLLRLWAIDVDGATAGVVLGWRVGARAFSYSQAFDHAYARYGIGMALLAHTVRASAEEGCATFDMLRGDERFKADFHTSREAVVSYRAVRRRSFARLQADAVAGARAAYLHMPSQRRGRLRRTLGM